MVDTGSTKAAIRLQLGRECICVLRLGVQWSRADRSKKTSAIARVAQADVRAPAFKGGGQTEACRRASQRPCLPPAARPNQCHQGRCCVGTRRPRSPCRLPATASASRRPDRRGGGRFHSCSSCQFKAMLNAVDTFGHCVKRSLLPRLVSGEVRNVTAHTGYGYLKPGKPGLNFLQVALDAILPGLKAL